jgi:hypothetical protein
MGVWRLGCARGTCGVMGAAMAPLEASKIFEDRSKHHFFQKNHLFLRLIHYSLVITIW